MQASFQHESFQHAEKFIETFKEFGYTEFGGYDGFCPRSTILTVMDYDGKLNKLMNTLYEPVKYKISISGKKPGEDGENYTYGFIGNKMFISKPVY